jgi:hypothetical protein
MYGVSTATTERKKKGTSFVDGIHWDAFRYMKGGEGKTGGKNRLYRALEKSRPNVKCDNTAEG